MSTSHGFALDFSRGLTPMDMYSLIIPHTNGNQDMFEAIFSWKVCSPYKEKIILLTGNFTFVLRTVDFKFVLQTELLF